MEDDAGCGAAEAGAEKVGGDGVGGVEDADAAFQVVVGVARWAAGGADSGVGEVLAAGPELFGEVTDSIVGG